MYSLNLPVLLTGTLFASLSLHAEVTLDFESDPQNGVVFNAGDVINNQYANAPYFTTFSFAKKVFNNLGSTPTGVGNTAPLYNSKQKNKVLMTFDSQNPTGGDPDLATPSDGLIGIISEDGDSQDPDDNARGGVMRMEFSVPVILMHADLVDIEENKTGFYALYDDNGSPSYSTFAAAATANGMKQTVNFGDFDGAGNGVTQLDLFFKGSGALSSLTFRTMGDFTPIPEPSTVVALGSLGLIALVAFLRHRRRS